MDPAFERELDYDTDGFVPVDHERLEEQRVNAELEESAMGSKFVEETNAVAITGDPSARRVTEGVNKSTEREEKPEFWRCE